MEYINSFLFRFNDSKASFRDEHTLFQLDFVHRQVGHLPVGICVEMMYIWLYT